MKKLGILIAVFGVFVLAGSISASTTEEIQPAQITYNENLVVNGGMDVSEVTYLHGGVHVGDPGTGGVTYFNGSIQNIGEDTPVTIADDLRVDGTIYRLEAGGDNSIKVADSIRPNLDNHYELGSDGYQWTRLYAGNGYFSGTVTTTGLSGTGIVSSANILNGTITGEDISSSADLSVDSITATGDINQSRTKGGAVKAMVYCNGAGSGSTARSWTYNDTSVTCSREAEGSYIVGFGFKVDDRFYDAVSNTADYSRSLSVGATSTVALERQLFVQTRDTTTGNFANSHFTLFVY